MGRNRAWEDCVVRGRSQETAEDELKGADGVAKGVFITRGGFFDPRLNFAAANCRRSNSAARPYGLEGKLRNEAKKIFVFSEMSLRGGWNCREGADDRSWCRESCPSGNPDPTVWHCPLHASWYYVRRRFLSCTRASCHRASSTRLLTPILS